jgi:hypothetical protein
MEWSQTPIRPIDRYRCVAFSTPLARRTKRIDPGTMLVRYSGRGNAAAAKSRGLSQLKKRYVTSALLSGLIQRTLIRRQVSLDPQAEALRAT